MSYEDLLRKYQRLDRTRIFGADWRITQQWTSLHVPWSADYHQTRFSVHVTRTTPVVIVLSQLDKTYFAGLQGQYNFKLLFRVQRLGDEEDYIVRSNVDYYMTRSVSTDITLEAGSYFVLMKITAIRVAGPTLDEVISAHAEHMREKLIQVGLSYDIAHAKGVVVETEKEKEQRQWFEKAQAAAERERRKNQAKFRKEAEWKKAKGLQQRNKMKSKRRERLADERAARRPPEADDGYHRKEADCVRQPIPDQTAGDATATVNGGGPLAEDFIAAYESSNGTPCPTVNNPEDRVGESITNDLDRSLRTSVTPSDGETNSTSAENHQQDHHPVPKVQVNGIDAVTNFRRPKRRPAPLMTETTADGTFDATPRERHAGPPSPPGWSGSATESEFEWQTDLDYESNDDTPSPRKRTEHGDEGGDDYRGPEPWNAVCVVGLRVFSKDPDLWLEVVRPNPYSNHAGSQGAGGALDRDDPAKGAVAEKWTKTPLRETFTRGAENSTTSTTAFLNTIIN